MVIYFFNFKIFLTVFAVVGLSFLAQAKTTTFVQGWYV